MRVFGPGTLAFPGRGRETGAGFRLPSCHLSLLQDEWGLAPGERVGMPLAGSTWPSPQGPSQSHPPLPAWDGAWGESLLWAVSCRTFLVIQSPCPHPQSRPPAPDAASPCGGTGLGVGSLSLRREPMRTGLDTALPRRLEASGWGLSPTVTAPARTELHTCPLSLQPAKALSTEDSVASPLVCWGPAGRGSGSCRAWSRPGLRGRTLVSISRGWAERGQGSGPALADPETAPSRLSRGPQTDLPRLLVAVRPGLGTALSQQQESSGSCRPASAPRAHTARSHTGRPGEESQPGHSQGGQQPRSSPGGAGSCGSSPPPQPSAQPEAPAPWGNDVQSV